MAETLKVLAQSNPNATTLTSIYTVPASTSSTVSSIVVCNTTANVSTFRISVAKNGAADVLTQYIYYNQPIESYSSFIITIGITLAATDVIRVYSGNANITYNVFGIEVS